LPKQSRLAARKRQELRDHSEAGVEEGGEGHAILDLSIFDFGFWILDWDFPTIQNPKSQIQNPYSVPSHSNNCFHWSRLYGVARAKLASGLMRCSTARACCSVPRASACLFSRR